jgi:hypothetical protein
LPKKPLVPRILHRMSDIGPESTLLGYSAFALGMALSASERSSGGPAGPFQTGTERDEGAGLPIEPHVLKPPAVENAIDDQVEALDARPPAGRGAGVVHSGELSVTQAGREGVVQRLSRGALLGEVAFFENRLRTATVTATTPCSILSLEFERFRKFLLAHPDSALLIAARIARMLRNAEATLVELECARRTG